jgi:hypothetical protein
MKKTCLFLGFIIICGLLADGTPADDYYSQNTSLRYLKEYRYKKKNEQSRKEFLEYKILLRAALKVYFDFSSLGAQNFKRDIIDYAEWLLARTQLLNVFLMVCDRMVRNIAFDPRLYDINIKTGKANDHFASRIIR